MKVLVTGSNGFVGTNLVNYLEKNQLEVITLDSSSNLRAKHITYTLGLKQENPEKLIEVLKDVTVVIHLADYHEGSVLNSRFTISNNIGAISDLLDSCFLAMKTGSSLLQKIIILSSDEVCGTIESGSHFEKSSFNCKSFYSATKAWQEVLSQAYIESYNLPIVIVRSVDIFGPNQFEEELIPTIVKNAMQDCITGVGNVLKQWVPVKHVCDFLNYVCVSSFIPPGTILHCTGSREITEMTLARTILNMLGKPANLISQFATPESRFSLGRGEPTEAFGCPEYNRLNFDRDLLEVVEFYKKRNSV